MLIKTSLKNSDFKDKIKLLYLKSYSKFSKSSHSIQILYRKLERKLERN